MCQVLLVLSCVVACVLGHGRVLQPPSRASAWRFGFPTAPNYDDDGLNCGGFSHQWGVNQGRCGICGDPYDAPIPRPHELGGKYGDGVIVASYLPGSLITTTVDITASHRGFWEFKLCPDPGIDDQECFDSFLLELEEGGTKYYPTRGNSKYSVNYRLPPGLVCDHCVLQWRYTAGNNWGTCANGTQGLGCGNQEQFGACSDISIGNSRSYEDNVLREQYQLPYPLVNLLKNGYFDAQQGEEVGEETESD
ncbi:uncharacterized protein LOC128675686 isoform X2 [Plodia interpunctella]|uniref:uncharacterized protein LOC128675686 isoform X2 n=1 Tax=Plodia interpunctella TaxID=58824 RepID=UPI003100C94C